MRRDEVVVEQAKRALPAPRHGAASKYEGHEAEAPEPARLAADLKQVTERFDADADRHDKAPAAPRPETKAAEAPKPAAEPAKAEQKPAAAKPQAQPLSVQAGPSKATARPAAGAARTDKGGRGRKG